METAALINSLAPLIAAFVKDHVNKHGQTPTDAEVKQWLETDVAAVTAISDAWLASHTADVNKRDGS